jgi:hypothetical protein
MGDGVARDLRNHAMYAFKKRGKAGGIFCRLLVSFSLMIFTSFHIMPDLAGAQTIGEIKQEVKEGITETKEELKKVPEEMRKAGQEIKSKAEEVKKNVEADIEEGKKNVRSLTQ